MICEADVSSVVKEVAIPNKISYHWADFPQLIISCTRFEVVKETLLREKEDRHRQHPIELMRIRWIVLVILGITEASWEGEICFHTSLNSSNSIKECSMSSLLLHSTPDSCR
jgi:hypothetical protein